MRHRLIAAIGNAPISCIMVADSSSLSLGTLPLWPRARLRPDALAGYRFFSATGLPSLGSLHKGAHAACGAVARGLVVQTQANGVY